MREIKFRAWNIESKEMWSAQDLVENQYYLYADGRIENNLLSYPGSLCIVNNEFVIMQYTGLKDKNGKEIYEGDIVKISGHTYGDNFTCQITEKRGGFWADRDYLGNWKEYMFEVIGNIYETPELLKRGE